MPEFIFLKWSCETNSLSHTIEFCKYTTCRTKIGQFYDDLANFFLSMECSLYDWIRLRKWCGSYFYEVKVSKNERTNLFQIRKRFSKCRCTLFKNIWRHLCSSIKLLFNSRLTEIHLTDFNKNSYLLIRDILKGWRSATIRKCCLTRYKF